MKKRTFYVVNLDRGRIMVLAIIFAGFVLVAFGMGHRLAKTPGAAATGSATKLGATAHSGERQSAKMGGSRYDISKDPIYGYGRRGQKGGSDYKDMRHDRDQKARGQEQGRTQERARSRGDRRRRRSARQEDDRGWKPIRNTKDRPRTRDRKDARQGDRVARTQRTRRTRRTQGRQARPDDRRARTRRRRATERRKDPRTALLKIRPGRGSQVFSNVDFAGRAGARARARAGARSSPSAKPATPYTLQLGTYRFRGSADRMATMLRRQGFQPRVVRRRGMYRVMVGAGATRAELSGLRSRLRAKRYAPITVRRKASKR